MLKLNRFCATRLFLLIVLFFRSSFESISNTFSLSLSQPNPALQFPSRQHIPRHSKQVQQHVTRPMQVDMVSFFHAQQQSTIIRTITINEKNPPVFPQ
jgi:hypothetical protein